MTPSCDQTGVPLHFHSSTTSGSAALMSLRILLRVSPRQSPSAAIRFEMSADADWPGSAADFFMCSPRWLLSQRHGRLVVECNLGVHPECQQGAQEQQAQGSEERQLPVAGPV